MTQLIRSEQEFFWLRSEEQQHRSRARQSEQSLEQQGADLAEQLRATNALLQEESAQLLERGAATQQELQEHAVARYREKSQVTGLQTTLEHHQRKHNNEEQQLQAVKRQFHEQGATLQTLQRDLQRTTLAEENAAQRYNLKLQALTEERDQERRNTEIAVQDQDEQHEAIVQLLMAHIAHCEKKSRSVLSSATL